MNPPANLLPSPTPEQLDRMLALALDVRRRAYAPYSSFLVGAALLDATGQIHLGCNVENASYGLTNCAERVAIGAAVAAGTQQFSGLLIVSQGGVPPCGACRQVLAEFAPRLPIWLVDVAQQPHPALALAHATNLEQLLPMQFVLRES